MTRYKIYHQPLKTYPKNTRNNSQSCKSVEHAKITNPSRKPDTMEPPKRKSRSTMSTKLTKTNSKTIVDKITYNPIKRNLRAKQKNIPKTIPASLSPKLKFGSFNVNGLDIEAAWAVEQLLTKRGFDVSLFTQ